MRDGLVILSVMLFLILFGVNGFIASKASDIAQDKGYEKRLYFHLCFWFGIFGYLLVCAMPDLELRKQLKQFGDAPKEIITLLQKGALQTSTGGHKQPMKLPEL